MPILIFQFGSKPNTNNDPVCASHFVDAIVFKPSAISMSVGLRYRLDFFKCETAIFRNFSWGDDVGNFPVTSTLLQVPNKKLQ